MERARRVDLLRVRRRLHERVAFENDVIWLRDQAPLHKGSLDLPVGFSFEDLVESLNKRVFFWPGAATGPNNYGVRHFERYKEENPAVIRIEFRSLLRANSSAVPLYCRYNSGAPRCSYGRKSPRDPNTFMSAAGFKGTPAQVVEVTFCGEIELPIDSELGMKPSGPWRWLF